MISLAVSRGLHRALNLAPKSDPAVTRFIAGLIRAAILAAGAMMLFFRPFSVGDEIEVQGTLSNVAAGVMLMLLCPYKLSEYVEVTGEAGIVRDINLFTTELATLDNIKVIITSAEVWGITIKNYTSMSACRVDVDCEIHYDDDIDKAIKIINDVANAHSKVLKTPEAPWAKVVTLNESSVDIQSRVWCDAADYWDVNFDLKKSIKEAFDKNGITIPYPHSVELDG